MKFVIFSCLLALAVARPDNSVSGPDSDEVVKNLRDDRVHPADGSYSSDVETPKRIKRSQSRSPLDIEGYPTGQQETTKFTFPNGEKYDLKFVANEHGFQPESSWLQVAPEFPHPIPQFVLDQIASAALQDSREDPKPSQDSDRPYTDSDSDLQLPVAPEFPHPIPQFVLDQIAFAASQDS